MSNLTRFFKNNKVTKENKKFAPTRTLLDEAGEPLEFEFKHLSTREDEQIRDECTMEIQVKGKPGQFRPKLDTSRYQAKMIVASCVEPDLLNAQLQDSYGVKTPEDLLKELVDDPGEYIALANFISEMNGFTSQQEKVDEAKN